MTPMTDVIRLMAEAMEAADRVEGRRFTEYCQAMVRAALRAAEDAGWKLVPMEATEEMIDATGAQAEPLRLSMGKFWKEMARAAPRWEP